jgi:uncharacterized membrane protein HdeD (DUF308 family)
MKKQQEEKDPWGAIIFIGIIFIMLAAIKLTMPLKAIIAALGLFNIIIGAWKMKIPDIKPEAPKSFEETWRKKNV